VSLIDALRDPRCYPHAVARVELIETHISWVLLTGEYAYKIRKPVKLPFLDFSTLALRQHDCEEELRLNRGLAPDLYLDVVPIAGDPSHPRVHGTGAILEYAVKMRQFAQDRLASRLVRQNAITPRLLAGLAAKLGDFHARTAVADPGTDYGSPARVRGQVDTLLRELDELLIDHDAKNRLTTLCAWFDIEFERLREELADRKQSGRIRECHGDLHLGNVVLLGRELTPFDCIEFNADLRWIDVMSETAFLAMDLDHAGRSDLASLFLDAYLQHTGDYAGLAVLPCYLVYRALVRVLANALRANKGHADAYERAKSYLELAARHTTPGRGMIVVMHGLSGSGKSTVALGLAGALGGMRIRSDVERKRMHGFDALARTGSALGSDLYAEHASDATYDRLRDIAACVARAGYPAIVDAACLKHEQREIFRALARELHLPFVIVSVEADPDILRERVARRHAQGHDPSEATLEVLEHQLAATAPFEAVENADTLIVSGTEGLTAQDIARVRERAER